MSLGRGCFPRSSSLASDRILRNRLNRVIVRVTREIAKREKWVKINHDNAHPMNIQFIEGELAAFREVKEWLLGKQEE